jgi:hypothetical protein
MRFLLGDLLKSGAEHAFEAADEVFARGARKNIPHLRGVTSSRRDVVHGWRAFMAMGVVVYRLTMDTRMESR